MNEIIETIFKQEEYLLKRFNDELTYYSYQDAAFYFLLELEENDFENILRYTDFENLQKYKKFKKNFDLVEKEVEANTVERNSSLIILVRCNSISALEKYKHQILLLEEDEFFFKKYVILYSEKAIQGLKVNDDFLSTIQQKVQDKNQFKLYAKKGLLEELEEYLLILQLYIKLPFLKLTFDGDSFQSLQSKIVSDLDEQQEVLYRELVSKSEDILALNFELEENEIDEILNLLTDD